MQVSHMSTYVPCMKVFFRIWPLLLHTCLFMKDSYMRLPVYILYKIFMWILALTYIKPYPYMYKTASYMYKKHVWAHSCHLLIKYMDIIIMIIATYVQLIQTWQFLITFHFLIKKKYFQDEFRHSIAHMCTCTYVHVILNAQQYTCTYTLHFILRAIFKNIRLSANVVYCRHIVRKMKMHFR